MAHNRPTAMPVDRIIPLHSDTNTIVISFPTNTNAHNPLQVGLLSIKQRKKDRPHFKNGNSPYLSQTPKCSTINITLKKLRTNDTLVRWKLQKVNKLTPYSRNK